ncbi:MAG: trypsin-like peptidase domain-containing protein [Ignavibacteriae bacterium]|nr:trypsin-like peptidase domain-containing protein [Ignavibacteriota bacterium]
MEIELIHTTGRFQGKRIFFTEDPDSAKRPNSHHLVERRLIKNGVIKIGRHYSNDICFHPDRDAVVSGKHAEISLEDNYFVLQDLNSSNGTYANGIRISKHILKPKDIIEFGRGGPKLQCDFLLRQSDITSTIVLQPESQGYQAVGKRTVQLMVKDLLADANKVKALGLNTTTFMRDIVAQVVNKTSKKARRMFLIVIIILPLGMGSLLYHNISLKKELATVTKQQRESLLLLQDEFLHELQKSRERVQSLQQRIEQAKRDVSLSSTQIHGLEILLQSERQKTQDITIALQAAKDSISKLGMLTKEALRSIAAFQQVAIDNAESIFMICCVNQLTSETITIGSGFVVRENGYILTNAHVGLEIKELVEQTKNLYIGLVIQNENPTSRYIIRGIIIHPQFDRNAKYSPDIACVRVDNNNIPLRPVVFAPQSDYLTLDKGYEIAVIGFPGLTMNADNPIATFSRGVIGRIIDKVYIQHDCQTSGGNSGSPLLNKKGQLVGIHYGSRGNVPVLVPIELPDSNGVLQTTVVTKRIKEAVGINEGIRVDVIEDFLRLILPS